MGPRTNRGWKRSDLSHRFSGHSYLVIFVKYIRHKFFFAYWLLKDWVFLNYAYKLVPYRNSNTINYEEPLMNRSHKMCFWFFRQYPKSFPAKISSSGYKDRMYRRSCIYRLRSRLQLLDLVWRPCIQGQASACLSLWNTNSNLDISRKRVLSTESGIFTLGRFFVGFLFFWIAFLPFPLGIFDLRVFIWTIKQSASITTCPVLSMTFVPSLIPPSIDLFIYVLLQDKCRHMWNFLLRSFGVMIMSILRDGNIICWYPILTVFSEYRG